MPFGVAAPPPPPSERPLRAHFPQIGQDDPVVLWWGKVWKWFDAGDGDQSDRRSWRSGGPTSAS